MPGFPVLHCLLEVGQTRVHWVSDAVQPSRPLSSPSPPALCISQHQGLFQWVCSSNQVAKVLELQHEYSRLISFRIDWLDLLAWSLSPRGLKSSEKDQHAQKLLLTQDRMCQGSKIYMECRGSLLCSWGMIRILKNEYCLVEDGWKLNWGNSTQ